MKTLALIGCGYWGKNLARNFNALGALHTLCDAATETLNTYGKEYEGVRKVQEVESVWSDPEIHQVAIAAPAVLHYRLAKAALMAGKDVYVEKPLCLNPDEGEELVGLADKLGRILMVGHLLQYHPCIQKLQKMIARGDLGKLHYVTSNRLNLGKIRREENALWSFAPHDISVILSLAGNRLPELVRCTGEAYLNRDVADTTLTMLKFAGGVRAHIYVSWLNPFKEQKLTVVGSSGMAVFDDTKPWKEKLVVHKDYLTWANGSVPTPTRNGGEPIEIAESEPLRNECEHFLDCCQNRSRPRTDGREGLRVLEVLQAAQQSLETDGAGIHLSADRPSSGSACRAMRERGEHSLNQGTPPLPSLSPAERGGEGGRRPGEGVESKPFFHHEDHEGREGSVLRECAERKAVDPQMSQINADLIQPTKGCTNTPAQPCHDPVAPRATSGERDRERGVDTPSSVLRPPSADYYVHPSAFVDEGAVIGKGTKIWHFCHVMKGAQIGERCVLGQNINVDGGTKIGNNVKIQNNVSVYTGVEIEDDVFLGPSCVLTNVTNPRSQINRHSLYERTLVKRGATIGANATIVCGVTIGRYAFIAAGAVVTKDVPDYALIIGNPGRQKGWMSRHGHVLKGADADGILRCPEAGLRYKEFQSGALKCLDLDEDAPLPEALRTGKIHYDSFKTGTVNR